MIEKLDARTNDRSSAKSNMSSMTGRERERETSSRLRRFYRTIRDKSRAVNPSCPLIHPCQSRGIKLHYRIIMEEWMDFPRP